MVHYPNWLIQAFLFVEDEPEPLPTIDPSWFQEYLPPLDPLPPCFERSRTNIPIIRRPGGFRVIHAASRGPPVVCCVAMPCSYVDSPARTQGFKIATPVARKYATGVVLFILPLRR